MSILALKQLLRERKVVNVQSMLNYFGTELEVLQPMLERLVRKQQVRKCPQMPGCGSQCQRCDPTLMQIYQWVEPANSTI